MRSLLCTCFQSPGDAIREGPTQQAEVAAPAPLPVPRRSLASFTSFKAKATRRDDVCLCPPEAILRDIKLISVLGTGGFGCTYRGYWKGHTEVAVKIAASPPPASTAAEQAAIEQQEGLNLPNFGRLSAPPTKQSLEAILATKLAHPNIVQTFAVRQCILTPAFMSAVEMQPAAAVNRTSSRGSTATQQLGILTLQQQHSGLSTAAAHAAIAASAGAAGGRTDNNTRAAATAAAETAAAAAAAGGSDASLTPTTSNAGAASASSPAASVVADLHARGPAAAAAAAAGEEGPSPSQVFAKYRWSNAANSGVAFSPGGMMQFSGALQQVQGGAAAAANTNNNAVDTGNTPLHRPAHRVPASNWRASQDFLSHDGFGAALSREAVNTGLSWAEVLDASVAQAGDMLTVIIMEYCDCGTLEEAIVHGTFTAQPADDLQQRRRRLRALLHTAREIAAGLDHMHSKGIVHGDIKPANVLLIGSRTDKRGFTARLADFGLSQITGPSTSSATDQSSHHNPAGAAAASSSGVVISAANSSSLENGQVASRAGTAQFMAPETFVHGIKTAKCDIFALGMLIWTMATAQRPYGDMDSAEIAETVGRRAMRPAWPQAHLQALGRLYQWCVAQEAAQRPSAGQVERELRELDLAVRRTARRMSGGSSLLVPAAGPAPPVITTLVR